jgi:hypothetical protein
VWEKFPKPVKMRKNQKRCRGVDMPILEIIKDLLAIIVSSVGVAGVIVAVCTYRKANSIKRIEFINQLYSQFLEKELYAFYGSLLQNPSLEIAENSREQYLSDKTLTLFDEVCNSYEQRIINDDSLSYIACEILDFYTHPSVNAYLKETEDDYTKKKYLLEIRPYSGFSWLGEYLSGKYLRHEQVSLLKRLFGRLAHLLSCK